MQYSRSSIVRFPSHVCGQGLLALVCSTVIAGLLQICVARSGYAQSQPGESTQAHATLLDFQRQKITGTYYSEGVGVGDINGDQVNDVVYGPHWYAGPDFTESHEIYPAKPQPMEGYADHFFAWVHDVDRDGAADVFVVGFPGTPAYVYRNPGKGVGEWTKHQVIDWVSNESPQFVQLVGDKTPELVCTRDGFFGFATINPDSPLDSWQFHAISKQTAASKFGHGLGVGDVNGDGLQDILHAGGWFQQPESNPTTDRWISHAAKFSQAYGGADMFAYDVDGDGDNDVITSEAAHDFGLSWYEQQTENDETIFKQHVIMGQHPSENAYGLLFSELHSVALADMDGDGLKDIVTGKTYYSHHQQSPMWDAGAVVYWFKLERNADGVNWIPFLADGEPGIGRQLVVTDIDQDGLLDVASGGMLGANVLLQSRRQVSKDEYAAALPKKFSGAILKPLNEAQRLRGARSPLDADGLVAEAIEAETLNAEVTSGTAVAQPMGNFSGDKWSGDSQLWWSGGRPGDTLSLEIDVMRDVEAIQLCFTCANDYAIVEALLDGEPLAKPFDLYEPAVVTTGLIEFKTPKLNRGKHTLTVKVVGANDSAAKKYMVGIDYLRFRGKGQEFPEIADGIIPRSSDGRQLNLDFETGTLDDWTVEGVAFEGQPIRGDTIAARRADSRSGHTGEYWIGGFEKLRDAPVGTLTSAPFVASARYASFYLGGGSVDRVRVELFAVGEKEPFFTIGGKNKEDLEQVVVDLRRVQNNEMYVRLVDASNSGWGHINFDHFRLHNRRPAPLTTPSAPLVADEYPFQGLEAVAAADAMVVPEGFQVTVAAAEPDVKQPIAMALDDRGRVWIAEAYEYPQRAQGDSGKDRILIFEDTTGDGKLDSRKVFAEGLNLVSGLEVGFGGVWVGAAPYLLFIPDRDGDDVPDSEPQILLDGWGYQDTHETLNAFCWGPDGWLYGCHGVFTYSNVGKPGTPLESRTSLNAGVWRYHPTRHEFEVFAHGTSNPWGVDFNEHGEAFVTACVIPHLYHMIPGARYRRQAGKHFNEYTYDDIPTIADHLHYLGSTPHSGNGKSDEAGGGHAHAGAMIYQGGAWPEQYQGALFMNNIHGQRLNTDLLEPEGSGYVGHHGPDFLLTKDQASQILNMRYGPDGQVTMIDWYDMQACHRREVEVHDRSNGRIYKISYGEPKSVQVNLATKSDLELAEYCVHENDWYVRHARRLLMERSTVREIEADAIAKLREIAVGHPDDTRRLRAVWACDVTGNLGAELLAKLRVDTSPHVRGWALRLDAAASNFELTSDQLEQLSNFAALDPSPVVRRSIASVVDRLPVADRWDVAVALTSHSEDAGDHNLPLMYWYCIEPLAEINPDRALALGMSAGEQIPLLRQYMLRRVAGAGGAAALERLVAGLSKVSEPSIQLTFLDAIRAALAGQRRATAPVGWTEASRSLLSSENEEVQLQAVALGVTFGDSSAMQRLTQTITSSKSPVSQRLDALQALLDAKAPELASVLLQLVTDEPQSDLREAAIRGVAQYDAPESAGVLIDAYGGLSPAERRAAIATLASRESLAIALLKAIGEQQIPASDLTADLARQIEYLESAEVTELLAKNWGQVKANSADKARLIAEFKAMVERTDAPEPDLQLGRAIFSKTCQRCHILYGVGEKLGPDLTGSNRANVDYLLENILNPSAVMANEYRQSIFLTDSGQVITGIVQSENDRAVTIQTADAEVVLPKDEIEQRRASELSMMPENQLAVFNDHEVRSLIGYLRSKAQNPILATEENASQFFNGMDLSGWSGNEELWSVEDGEIVGRSSGLKKNEFLISDLSAEDFRLSLEIKLVENAGNSGIQFRSAAREDSSVEGYQADVGAGWWGKLYEEHGRALLWDKSGEEHVRVGEWNRYDIQAIGGHIVTKLNGVTCVDLEDPDGAKRGVFALQLHSGGPTEVRFRNVKLELLYSK